MSRAIRVVACLLVVGLLAAPVARACCQMGPLEAPCDMDGGMGAGDAMPAGHAMPTAHAMAPVPSAAATMAIAAGGNVAPMPCHGDRRLSTECCEPAPGPSPAVGKPAGPRELPTELELAALGVPPPPAAVEAPVPATPPRSARLQDLGRYTLFSSLLL